GFLYRSFDKVFDALRDAYAWTLNGVVRHRFVTMVVAAGTLAGTVYMYTKVPTGFIPSQDTGQFTVQTEFAHDASFDIMARVQKELTDAFAGNPNIDALMSRAGATGTNGGNSGWIQVRLKPRPERKATPEEIMDQLRPKVNAIPGVRAYFQNPPLIRIGGYQSRSLYQYTLQSQDLKELYAASADFEKQMRDIPGLIDVSSDLQVTSPEVLIDIDRDHASALGVTADQVETALFSAYGSRQVSSIYTPTNDYQVIMELMPAYQRDPSSLNLLYV